MITIDLTKKVRQIAPEGDQSGVIADLYVETVKSPTGKEVCSLVVVVQLAAADDDGKRFEVSGAFGLGNRAKQRLIDEVTRLRGSPLTAAELKTFEAEGVMLGKPCTARVVHKVEAGRMVAKLGGLLPATDATIKVSENFVRHEDEDAEAVTTTT